MDERGLIDLCLQLAEVYEDYPFGEDWAVMRHKGNCKSFAMIYRKGGDCFINLKCEPMQADFYRSLYAGVTPGYHMNKEHWNSVRPQSDVPPEELESMIAHSYRLTAPRKGAGRKSSAQK